MYRYAQRRFRAIVAAGAIGALGAFSLAGPVRADEVDFAVEPGQFVG